MSTYTGNSIPNNKATLVFIGVLILVILLVFTFSLPIHPGRLVGYMIALAFEAYTIANRHQSDTISEGFWQLASRPLIPWMAGSITTYYITVDIIKHPAEVLVVGALNGHFFWQADKIYKEYQARG